MELSAPAAGHHTPVACRVLPSPLPTIAGAADLIDTELLDTLPPIECDGMLMEQSFAMVPQPTSHANPWTPPVNAPSPPGAEQPPVSSKPPSRESLAAYSADELRQKRSARLARNRRSAQELRNRKRQYAERVEEENETLRTQSSQLQARVSSLTAENSLLREENNFYRGMLAGRAAGAGTSSAQTPTTPQRVAPVPATANGRKSARGVGLLASLLAVIGMTVNQEPVPSRMDGPGLVAGASLPVSSRRALSEIDETENDERLALPDKDLLTRQESSATAIASDVGLVVRDAAAPLVPTAGPAEASSVATLQFGTRRFVLVAADSAVRCVATPLAGTDSAIAVAAPMEVEQDDYILGGPTRVSVPLAQQHHVAEGTTSKDTAVALSWTDDDTTEFLVRMLASMDVQEKHQVLNMLVREYGADVFGGLFERAMTAAPADTEGRMRATKPSESLWAPASPSGATDPLLAGVALPCDCAQEMENQDDMLPPHPVVSVVQSTGYAGDG